MALLFSEVTLRAEDRQRKFLVSGIPMDLDDLDGWTAYEDFLLELEDETSVKFICDDLALALFIGFLCRDDLCFGLEESCHSGSGNV